MDQELQRAINLAKKTGDRLIIIDSSQPGNALVVMPLAEYEKMMRESLAVRNLTESELVDKINRDIAVWKNEQLMKEETQKRAKDYFVDETKIHINESNYRKSDLADIEPGNLGFAPDFFVESQDQGANIKEKKKKHWQIPPDRKEGAEEVVEEDRQYLEEITF